MIEFDRCKILYDRLVGQLDTLVPFLALAHREIFDLMSSKYYGWYSEDQQHTLPDTYEAYNTQIAHSAFLLGYSYTEAFVTDLMWEVYSTWRDLLPKDKTIMYSEVLSRSDFDNVVKHMIDSTVSDMNSLEKKLLHMEKRFALQIPKPDLMDEAHIARNALVHNAGRVNRLGKTTVRWRVEDTITLKVEDVHNFGIMARTYTRQICERASILCNQQPS